MSATHSEDRPPDIGLFALRPAPGYVDDRAARSLLLELSTPAALDRISRAGIDGESALWAVDFATEGEIEFARALEAHRILWRYKPRTFAVEWDDEGNFLDSFTPAFYLPGEDRYFELTAPDSPVAGTARKVRLLRRQYDSIKIDLILWPGLSLLSKHRVQALDDEKADC